jgi:hypothetical protein
MTAYHIQIITPSTPATMTPEQAAQEEGRVRAVVEGAVAELAATLTGWVGDKVYATVYPIPLRPEIISAPLDQILPYSERWPDEAAP